MFRLGGFGFNSYYSRQHRLRVYRASKSSQAKSNEEQQETEEDMIEKDAEYAIISKVIEEPCFITLHKFVNRMANAQTDHGKTLLAYGVKGAEERDSTEDYKMHIVNSWQGNDQKKENDNEKYPEILVDVSNIVSAIETCQDYARGNYTYVCKLTCLYTKNMSSSSWNIIEPAEEVYRLIEEAKTKKLEKIMKIVKKLRSLQLQDNSAQQETEEL